MSLSIESGEEIKTHTCPECGRPYQSVHGFVYEDGAALSVYFAALYSEHPEFPHRLASLGIGIGEWGEDSGYGDRRAVGINVWATEDQFQMAILDPESSPWSASRVIGPVMAREEALGHPELQTFFHIAEHIITQDPVVSPFFGGEP